MEMRCYHRVLGISYRDHISNIKICEIITKNIDPHEELLTTVKKRKLMWYEHVTGSKTKTIIQGTVEDGECTSLSQGLALTQGSVTRFGSDSRLCHKVWL
ncbi:hypothetical protein BsWGS_10078 [Bradybaena similaris]